MGSLGSQHQDQPRPIKIHLKSKILSYQTVFQEECVSKTIQQPPTHLPHKNNVNSKPISIKKIPSMKQTMKKTNENDDVNAENSGNVNKSVKSKKLINEEELPKVLPALNCPSPKVLKEIKVEVQVKAKKEEQKIEMIKKPTNEKSPTKSVQLSKAKLNNPIRKELQRVYDL